MPLSIKWLRPLEEKGARRDESAAGAGCAVSLPGVSEAWMEARRLPNGALAHSTANDRDRATSKRRCLDCDGSGKE